MRFKVTVPVILLGAPIPDSENPLIAAPVADATVDVDVRNCNTPMLEAEGLGALTKPLEEFWIKLLDGFKLRLCSRLELIEPRGAHEAPLGGLYASLTSLLVHILNKLHGVKTDVLEVVEITSLLDLIDVDRSWRLVVEALRYSSLTGRMAAYRGPLEVYEFERSEVIKIKPMGRIEGVKSLISRSLIGESVYGALVHLAGEMVLEASIRVRDGHDVASVVKTFKPLHDAVILATYGLKPGSPSCLWSPSTPWSFDEICLVT